MQQRSKKQGLQSKHRNVPYCVCEDWPGGCMHDADLARHKMPECFMHVFVHNLMLLEYTAGTCVCAACMRRSMPDLPGCCRSSASVATASNAASSSETPTSLQQRMQQALTADIAPSGAPRNMPNPLQRPGLGSGLGSGPWSEGGSMREEDTGFWDLVYILYPDFAEATGVGSLRELVPHWSLLERTLMVLTHSQQPYIEQGLCHCVCISALLICSLAWPISACWPMKETEVF